MIEQGFVEMSGMFTESSVIHIKYPEQTPGVPRVEQLCDIFRHLDKFSMPQRNFT